MAGLQSGECRMMIDSVVWAQYINETDTQTDRQPRRHSKCRANALRREAKIEQANRERVPVDAAKIVRSSDVVWAYTSPTVLTT